MGSVKWKSIQFNECSNWQVLVYFHYYYHHQWWCFSPILWWRKIIAQSNFQQFDLLIWIVCYSCYSCINYMIEKIKLKKQLENDQIKNLKNSLKNSNSLIIQLVIIIRRNWLFVNITIWLKSKIISEPHDVSKINST